MVSSWVGVTCWPAGRAGVSGPSELQDRCRCSGREVCGRSCARCPNSRHSLAICSPSRSRATNFSLSSMGSGRDEDTYRQWFTSRFIPGATAEQARWFNEMERISATPQVAERHLMTSAHINVVDLLPRVRTPTLVLHCRGDLDVPFALGREMAAGIPGARFVSLGKNHIFLANELAHRAFFDAALSFLGDRPIKGSLPGTAGAKERLDMAVRSIEQNWIIKLVVILAAIAGVVVSIVEIWRMWP
jgi:hypothetical protein